MIDLATLKPGDIATLTITVDGATIQTRGMVLEATDGSGKRAIWLDASFSVGTHSTSLPTSAYTYALDEAGFSTSEPKLWFCDPKTTVVSGVETVDAATRHSLKVGMRVHIDKTGEWSDDGVVIGHSTTGKPIILTDHHDDPKRTTRTNSHERIGNFSAPTQKDCKANQAELGIPYSNQQRVCYLIADNGVKVKRIDIDPATLSVGDKVVVSYNGKEAESTVVVAMDEQHLGQYKVVFHNDAGARGYGDASYYPKAAANIEKLKLPYGMCVGWYPGYSQLKVRKLIKKAPKPVEPVSVVEKPVEPKAEEPKPLKLDRAKFRVGERVKCSRTDVWSDTGTVVGFNMSDWAVIVPDHPETVGQSGEDFAIRVYPNRGEIETGIRAMGLEPKDEMRTILNDTTLTMERIDVDPLTLAFGDKVEIKWRGKTIETTVVFVDHNASSRHKVVFHASNSGLYDPTSSVYGGASEGIAKLNLTSENSEGCVVGWGRGDDVPTVKRIISKAAPQPTIDWSTVKLGDRLSIDTVAHDRVVNAVVVETEVAGDERMFGLAIPHPDGNIKAASDAHKALAALGLDYTKYDYICCDQADKIVAKTDASLFDMATLVPGDVITARIDNKPVKMTVIENTPNIVAGNQTRIYATVVDGEPKFSVAMQRDTGYHHKVAKACGVADKQLYSVLKSEIDIIAKHQNVLKAVAYSDLKPGDQLDILPASKSSSDVFTVLYVGTEAGLHYVVSHSNAKITATGFSSHILAKMRLLGVDPKDYPYWGYIHEAWTVINQTPMEAKPTEEVKPMTHDNLAVGDQVEVLVHGQTRIATVVSATATEQAYYKNDSEAGVILNEPLEDAESPSFTPYDRWAEQAKRYGFDPTKRLGWRLHSTGRNATKIVKVLGKAEPIILKADLKHGERVELSITSRYEAGTKVVGATVVEWGAENKHYILDEGFGQRYAKDTSLYGVEKDKLFRAAAEGLGLQIDAYWYNVWNGHDPAKTKILRHLPKDAVKAEVKKAEVKEDKPIEKQEEPKETDMETEAKKEEATVATKENPTIELPKKTGAVKDYPVGSRVALYADADDNCVYGPTHPSQSACKPVHHLIEGTIVQNASYDQIVAWKDGEKAIRQANPTYAKPYDGYATACSMNGSVEVVLISLPGEKPKPKENEMPTLSEFPPIALGIVALVGSLIDAASKGTKGKVKPTEIVRLQAPQAEQTALPPEATELAERQIGTT